MNSRKFVTRGFIWITKFKSQVSTLLQDKMAHGNQMRSGACEGFPYRSVKLVLLANGYRYEMDSSLFYLNYKTFHSFRYSGPSLYELDPFHRRVYKAKSS
jgi:hypothetical protein